MFCLELPYINEPMLNHTLSGESSGYYIWCDVIISEFINALLQGTIDLAKLN